MAAASSSATCTRALHDAVLGANDRSLPVTRSPCSRPDRRLHCSPPSMPQSRARLSLLSEIRLGDDLGGHALALMSGDLTDAETALGICADRAGDQLLAHSRCCHVSTTTCVLCSQKVRALDPAPHSSPPGPSIRRRLHAPGTRNRNRGSGGDGRRDQRLAAALGPAPRPRRVGPRASRSSAPTVRAWRDRAR